MFSCVFLDAFSEWIKRGLVSDVTPWMKSEFRLVGLTKVKLLGLSFG